MYDFSWAWMNLTFLLPYFGGSLFVMKSLEKKRFFWLKSFLFVLVLFGWAALWTYINSLVPESVADDIWFTHITFIVQFALMILYLSLAYKGNFWSSFFGTTVSYSLQHFANRLYLAICAFIVIYLYPSESFGNFWSQWPGILICFAVNGLSYFLWWYLVLRKFAFTDEKDFIDKKVQITSSAAVIVFSIFLNSVIAYRATDAVIVMVDFLISSCISMLVVNLLYSSAVEKRTGAENERLRKMLLDKKADYQASKDANDVLNIKLHDIKHLLQTLNDSASPTVIQNIKDNLSAFDPVLKTGNEAIDLIVNKKEKECHEKGIKFTCYLDAQGLNYISPYELYTLFDNALNNAIDAVMKCPKEKRIISLHSAKKDNLLQIVFTNYYNQNELLLKNGMPVSTKDRNYHGFGIRSMQLITKKYDGGVTCSTGDELFNLYLYLPLQEEKTEKAK